MTTLDRGQSPAWQRALIPVGFGLSVAAHVAFAMTVEVQPPKAKPEDRWVEMTVTAPPPAPPPPPPPPPPEPPKPKAPPKVVDIKETTKTPPPTPTPAPAEPQKQVRRVAGLSASSFAKTGGTGFTAEAGTTLGAAPTKEKMTVEEAQQSVAYSAVTSRPTCDRPPFVVPEAVAAAGVEGQVRVVFDVSDTGQVQRVRVTGRLHPEADAACVAAWSKARCTPGQQGGSPVTVTNMPYYCTIKAID